jgi:integrase
MLEDYYVKPSTIDRVRSSWMAPQIESYLEWLQAHGYSRLVAYRRLPLLFHFAEFAQKKGCRDIASCKAYLKEFVWQWLEQHRAKTKTAVAVRKHAIGADCGVRQMLQLACKEPVTRNRSRRPFPLEAAVHREGITSRDLSGAVGIPQVYRLDDLPRSITWDEVRRMLEAVERRTIRGRRDYAILLLLVTYGLSGA